MICLADEDCPGEADRCVNQQCLRSCEDDEDCQGVEGGRRTTCDQGGCVECLSDDDCGGFACLPSADCEASPACGRFPASQFCGEGDLDGVAYCEVAVTGFRRQRCNNYCEAHDSVCVDGYDDGQGACDRAGNDGCNANSRSQICLCAREQPQD